MTDEDFNALQNTYEALNKALDRAKRQAYDVINLAADPNESLDYLIRQVMDSAHDILDLAHDFKRAAEQAAEQAAPSL